MRTNVHEFYIPHVYKMYKYRERGLGQVSTALESILRLMRWLIILSSFQVKIFAILTLSLSLPSLYTNFLELSCGESGEIWHETGHLLPHPRVSDDFENVGFVESM